jgi:hypothetical protein
MITYTNMTVDTPVGYEIIVDACKEALKRAALLRGDSVTLPMTTSL